MKKLPYWAKGGIIFTFIILIPSIYFFILYLINPSNHAGLFENNPALIFISLFNILGSLIFDIFSLERFFTSEISQVILIILINLVVVFILGSLIGYLYGTHKERKIKVI